MCHAPVFTTICGGIRLLRTKQLSGLTALARSIRFLFTSSSPKVPSRSRFSIFSKRDGNLMRASSVRKTSQLQLDPETLEGSSSSDRGLKKSPLQLLHLFFDHILRRKVRKRGAEWVSVLGPLRKVAAYRFWPRSMASMKGSIAPSMTFWMLPVSSPVRRSLTIW